MKMAKQAIESISLAKSVFTRLVTESPLRNKELSDVYLRKAELSDFCFIP